MGKVTGFLEFEREQPSRRKVGERLQDWLRLRLPRNAASMRAAAAGIEALVAQRGGGLTRAALAEWLATLQGSDHEDFAQST